MLLEHVQLPHRYCILLVFVFFGDEGLDVPDKGASDAGREIERLADYHASEPIRAGGNSVYHFEILG
jgi:hypothetical protein